MNLTEYLILQENVRKMVKPLESNIVIFYEHMIKWKYWKFEQCSSWVDSITKSVKSISNIVYPKGILNKNMISIISNKMEKCYKCGMEKAENEKKGISKDAENDKESVYDDFSNIDDILDLGKLKIWLLKYSNNDTSSEYVNRGFKNKFDL